MMKAIALAFLFTVSVVDHHAHVEPHEEHQHDNRKVVASRTK
jgi:hypothetical protein